MQALVFALVARVAIVGEPGGCPNPQSLGRALSAILPDVAIADDGDVMVRIEDAGERYRVTVGDVRRELLDSARRCDERARVAAVVVALAIQPPQVDVEAPLRTPPPAVDDEQPGAIAVPRPPPPPRAPLPAVLEFAGLLSLAPGADGGSLPMGGLAVRAVLGRTVALVVGGAMVTPSRMDLSAAAVDVIRIPFDLGVRLSARRGVSETAGEVGLRPSLLLLSGSGMGGNRLDLAVGTTVAERIWLTDRLATYGAVDFDVSLRPYDLVIVPDLIAGQTPRIWLGFSFGLAMRFE